MSFPSDIDPYNFFRNLFGGRGGGRGRREGRGFGNGWSFDDMFREFEEMRKETERSFVTEEVLPEGSSVQQHYHISGNGTLYSAGRATNK